MPRENEPFAIGVENLKKSGVADDAIATRAAAAFVSLNGHMRIRRQPNLVGRSFLSFSN
jgi:hypothetical protein